MEEDFVSRLLATFSAEAVEHVEAMSSGLSLLRDAPEQQGEIVEKIYREAHSLKGAARAVDMREVESACQSLEDMFAKLKSGAVKPSPRLLDRMQEAVDGVARLLPKESMPLEGRSKTDEPAGTSSQETVRVDLKKVGSVMRRAEELLSPKLAGRQRLIDLDEILGMFAGGEKRRSDILRMLRFPGNEGKLEVLMEAEMLAARALEARLVAFSKTSVRDFRNFSVVADELLQDAREMLMMPFSSMADAFPRFIRDISRELEKKIDLEIRGGEIEIDRRILEEIKEPIIHLLRNAADHGIEIPEERRAGGKTPEGRIVISLAQKDGGKVEIAVSDDGAGIDGEKIRTLARKLGLLAEDGGGEQVLPLLFRSGVSTSSKVTGISGRGLGLAIVQEKVEKLGGRIDVETARNSGTVFRMALPLTLATFRGIPVKAGGRLFILPSAAIERALRVEAEAIRSVENLESVEIEGRAISLSSLSEVLEMGMPDPAGGHVTLIVLGSAGELAGFRVEEILGEQEVLVKTLGPQLSRVRNIAGACLLGTGEVVPVLNAADLIKSATKKPAGRPASKEKKREMNILVVEDSITSRTLLKGILEAAGYKVSTAVDGVDALTILKTGSFDLVVSDVDMPRMNGFDLTAGIRSDGSLSALPVVLVTALDSREHREKGVQAGANAYIVKSSFDQSDLLRAVERLT